MSAIRIPTTGLPRSYLAGLRLSNNATDATNDIDIAVGTCRDATDIDDITLTSALTKRLDAAWAVGNNAGGLDTGSIANTTYHLWAIKRIDTGVCDVLFSASATAPTMPANYTLKRRIGSIMRVSAAIVPFTQNGDEFLRMVTVFDVNVSNQGTTAILYTLSVPTGIKVGAITSIALLLAAAAPAVLVTSPDQTDSVCTTSLCTIFCPANGTWMVGNGIFRTNTSAQVRARASAANCLFYIFTHGWMDTRGRND